MSAYYSLISANNEKVLCEATIHSGPYASIIQRFLKEKNPLNTKVMYQISNFIVHIYNDGQVTFLIVTDETFTKSHAFGYLLDLKNDFTGKVSQVAITESLPYGMQTLFAETMKKKMMQYVESKDKVDSKDKVVQLVESIKETQSIMTENLEKTMERGDLIEILVKKTQDINAQSSFLSSRLQRLNNVKQWQRIKVKMFVLLFLTVVLYGFFVVACGGLDLPCLFKD